MVGCLFVAHGSLLVSGAIFPISLFGMECRHLYRSKIAAGKLDVFQEMPGKPTGEGECELCIHFVFVGNVMFYVIVWKLYKVCFFLLVIFILCAPLAVAYR